MSQGSYDIFEKRGDAGVLLAHGTTALALGFLLFRRRHSAR